MPATGWGGTGAAAARGERGAARRVHISWRILQSFITDRATPPPDRCRFFGSPCVPSPVSGIRMPKLPLLLKNRKVSNLGALVSGIRMPRLPLLPVWEKGVGGMRGKGARKCRKSLLKAPVRRVAESVHRIAKHFFARYATGCMIKSARDQWRHMVQRSTHSLALRR